MTKNLLPMAKALRSPLKPYEALLTGWRDIAFLLDICALLTPGKVFISKLCRLHGFKWFIWLGKLLFLNLCRQSLEPALSDLLPANDVLEQTYLTRSTEKDKISSILIAKIFCLILPDCRHCSKDPEWNYINIW